MIKDIFSMFGAAFLGIVGLTEYEIKQMSEKALFNFGLIYSLVSIILVSGIVWLILTR